jgi:hypothetical protein
MDAINSRDFPAVINYPEVTPGLNLLLQAYLYARDVNRSIWDFAVELEELREAGLTNSDCRWLTCKGFVAQGRELENAADRPRQIAIENNLVFGRKTCFVLTPQGFEFTTEATKIVSDHNRSEAFLIGDDEHVRHEGFTRGESETPLWDPDRRQLSYAGILIKEFKSNSPNQESVLMAFEEEGWPPRIYDPLPPQADIEPKERLKNTIKSLNRKQKRPLIRFLGDGTGVAIRWESLFSRFKPIRNCQ